MPVVFPVKPAKTTQVANLPGSDFLKIHEATYRNAAKPYTNVTTERIPELFIVFPLSFSVQGVNKKPTCG
jgi:hypothetical protein